MKQEMNLYSRFQRDSLNRRSVGTAGTVLLGIVTCAVIMVVYGLTLAIERANIQSDIQSLNSFVTDRTNLDNYSQSNNVITQNTNLVTLKTALTEINTIFDHKQSINSQVLFEIMIASPLSLTIDSMNINGPTVTIQFSSTDQRAPAEFISNLRNRDIVLSVNYNGYSRSTSQDNIRYTGSATVILKGSF